jgi:hypothetical protein
MISIYKNSEQNARVSSGFVPYSPKRFSDIAAAIKCRMWSPIVWHNGNRSASNFHFAKFVALDFDSEVTLNDAFQMFYEYRHIIGTTKSHGIEKNGVIADRFRVIFQLSDVIHDGKFFAYLCKTLARQHGSDLAACDAGRLFFACKEIISIVDGTSICVGDYTEGYENERERYKHKDREFAAYKDLKKIPYEIECKIYSFVPKHGSRNNFIFSISSDLQKLGVSYEKCLEMIRSSAAFESYKDDADFVRSSLTTIKCRYREL